MSDDLFAAPVRTLEDLRRAEADCRRCPLYRDATQIVPGEGKIGAELMLVGEQPGDREDIAGKPFVGRAATSSTVLSTMPASTGAACSSPTRSSISSTNGAASAGCTSGRTPARSISAAGGSIWSGALSARGQSSRSAPRRPAAYWAVRPRSPKSAA